MLKQDGSVVGMNSGPVNVMDPGTCFKLFPAQPAPPAPSPAATERTRNLGVSFVLSFAYKRNTSLFTYVGLLC